MFPDSRRYAKCDCKNRFLSVLIYLRNTIGKKVFICPQCLETTSANANRPTKRKFGPMCTDFKSEKKKSFFFYLFLTGEGVGGGVSIF